MLIRYFDKLLLTDLDRFIQKMISAEKYIDNQNIGVHRKFNIEQQPEEYRIINRQDRTVTYTINECTLEEIKKALQ